MKKINLFKIVMLFLIAISFQSCMKPYQEEIYVEVAPNETAYVIPLEQGTKSDQSKFNSEKYLEQNKVAAKRIYIPTQWHKTGRWFFGYDGRWIPTNKVIIVNRAPVTREWTGAGNGTNPNKREDINVESKESIGFRIGITATASIPEQWSSKFLYKYNGRTLSEVMDNDVRGFIQNILTSEFGVLYLSTCQANRKDVFEKMRKQTIEHFAEFGIEIINIGAAGGFNYVDESIQVSINEKFASEMKFTTAENEVKAANKFMQAKEAIAAQKNLDADIEIKTAIAEGIRTGKLPVPSSFTTAGSSMSILDLYGLKGLSVIK